MAPNPHEQVDQVRPSSTKLPGSNRPLTDGGDGGKGHCNCLAGDDGGWPFETHRNHMKS